MSRKLSLFHVHPENGIIESSPEFLEKEKIRTKVFQHSHQAGVFIAREIASLIRDHKDETRPFVIVLSVDSALWAVYRELASIIKKENISLKKVLVFSHDEYYPIDPSSLQSHARWIRENFLDNVDIPVENVQLMEGTAPMDKIEKYIQEYDDKLAKYGVDLYLPSVSRGGYVGFLEPETNKATRTRFISLDPVTRVDAASEFFGEEYVPKKALSVGISHLLSARQVFLLAVSEGKAKIVKRLVEENITSDVTVSLLQQHPNVLYVADSAAASELTRFKAPWTIKNSLIHLQYTPKLIRKAVIWLALTTRKAILKLEDDDIGHNLLDLLTDHGPAHKLNVEVFNHLNRTITGWPGGKPKDSQPAAEPHTDHPPIREPYLYSTKGGKQYPKRIIVFSPHPDDDVISMGGTLRRLVEQGHEVHVAYQTSGNIAVRDDDSTRFANFATEFCKLFNISATNEVAAIEEKVEQFIQTKKPAQVDSREVQMIKGLIRRTEARNAARFCGVKPEHIHFLELPFYETGRVSKKPLGPEDIKIVEALLQQVKPHQIYAAGDLSDPHGTHRVCLKAIFAACENVKKVDWYKECTVWLYRGAWQEWDLWDVEMAVPMSPAELWKKRLAIYRHQSQKDTPPFPGIDKREFWERSEARNRQTAKIFDQLGLVEYEGMEAFVTWDVDHPENVPY